MHCTITRFALVVLDSVLGPAAHLTVTVSFSVVLEATHKASRGSLKGAVAAQKALLG